MILTAVLLAGLVPLAAQNGPERQIKHPIKTIKSNAFQLSAHFLGEWKPEYAIYHARHLVRRLSAEQLYDRLSQVTRVFLEIPIAGTSTKVKYGVQLRCPADAARKDLEHSRRTFAEHQAILQAIEARDPEAARVAMLRHLTLTKFYTDQPTPLELRVVTPKNEVE